MEWEAWLAETQTGQLGAKLAVLSGTWDESAGAAESVSVVADKGPLKALDPARWLVPWKTAIVLTADGQPTLFGPVINVPKISRNTVQFPVGGVLDILAQRYATADDYGPGQGTELAESVLSYSGLSLGSIMWRLVQQAMNRRGGALPIVHGSPDEASIHERNYRGFDISNLDTAHLLDLLSGVIGGPDYRFDAQWADEEHRRVQWAFRHGTTVSTDIPQQLVLTGDTTAPRAPISAPDVVCSWTPTGKVYATGAEEGAGVAITVVENESAMLNMPLLELTMSDTSAEELPLLTQRAQARLDRGKTMTVQVNTSIDASVGRHPSLWHVGDIARVKLGDEWWPLPPDMTARIVSRKGTLGSSIIDIELQAEVTV